MTPFVVARAQAGERSVPAWLEAIPTQMRILVHSLPARQVIDTQVNEQLIVELYSKTDHLYAGRPGNQPSGIQTLTGPPARTEVRRSRESGPAASRGVK